MRIGCLAQGPLKPETEPLTLQFIDKFSELQLIYDHHNWLILSIITYISFPMLSKI